MASLFLPRFLFCFVSLLSLVAPSHAQSGETLFASFAFVRTGERTPLLDGNENYTTLTPFGAEQMLSLGNTFRNRYISQNQTRIQGLSTSEINQLQMYLLADDTQYTIASAQAFMQALYPPHSPSSEESSGLSNGSSSQYPLSGYQYPWIQSVSVNDARSIFADGASTCLNWQNEQSYFTSPGYRATQTQSDDLYNRVGHALGNDDLPSSAYRYNNAFGVYDYVNYEYNHNATVRNALNGTGAFFALDHLGGSLDQLRAYSNDYQWGFYGQSPDNGSIDTIAGQTLSLAVLARLEQAIRTNGNQAKLSLIFGEFPAMLSFAALAQLPAVNQSFYGMPNYASTMVFELFSNNSTSLGTTDDESNLRVRFLFLNGTDTIDQPRSDTFLQYGLFGSNVIDMSYTQFSTIMSAAAISDPGEWCDVCNSWDVVPFCMAYNSTAWQAANGISSINPSQTRNGFHGGLSPTLAGVVGAVVTLAALCAFLVFAVGCCGMTLVQRKSKATNTSPAGAAGGLGGFKGARRLASDPDLTNVSPASPKAKNGISFGDGDDQVMGNERVGSWELKTPKRAARPRDEEEAFGFDGLGKEVHPADRL